MTEAEKQFFRDLWWGGGWSAAVALGLSVFLGGCQLINIADADNSGDETWALFWILFSAPLVLLVVAWTAIFAWKYGLPAIDRALLRLRGKEPYDA